MILRKVCVVRPALRGFALPSSADVTRRPRRTRSLAGLAGCAIWFLASLPGADPGWAEHGPGVPIWEYGPRNADEAAIVRLIRTVGEGWERRDGDLVMSAYALDAVQRAWNDPAKMIARDGIRAEAAGAFRDQNLGAVRLQDWIHRIYTVNASALVEINQKFHWWGRDHDYRDFWMFARRAGRWWLVRYDYEPQPPFDRR